ncbi:MAG: hypothetical protein KDK25_02675 [Leptospiraceae bacterium]|nr:hypothetical protein [Leptospiraceae bacterium]
MILGHYAAAYVARPYNSRAPFWLLLLCSNLAEFLWLLLALLGVEATTPASLLDATFQNLEVHMTYSHNLLPNLALGALVYGVVLAVYRQQKLALWSGFLTVSHVWLDFIVGFEHQILGPDSMSLGLNSYRRFPHTAIGIEWLFAMACLVFYFRTEARQGRPVGKKKKAWLLLGFSVGILLWLPNATIPMRDLLPF